MINFDAITPITFWLGTILPLVIVFVAGLLFVVGLFDYRQTRRLRRLPIVGGVITKSEIAPDSDGYYHTVVHYRYEVNGQIYESDSFFHDQKVMSYASETAREKIAPFPVGKTVKVHYRPETPQKSIVEIKSLIKFYFIGAIFFLFFAAVWAINFWIGEIWK